MYLRRKVNTQVFTFGVFTTSVPGSRYTYAIQSSSTSSILWRTATRSETSWPTTAALFWPYQVRAEEMQHPWIPARGTCRRQGSVEFDMCHWSEESRSSSWTSSKWSPCSKTCSGCSYSSWTCLSSLRQNLCFELWSPQSPSCPLMTVQQTTTSVQRLRRNRRTTTNKKVWAFDWHQDRWPWMTLNFISSNFRWISRDFADFGRNSSKTHEDRPVLSATML